MSVFEFSDDPSYKEQDVWVIPRGSAGFIKGWFVNTTRLDEFTSGEYADSPAAKLASRDETLGMITLSFRAAWGVGEDPPPPDFAGTKRAVVRGKAQEVQIKTKQVHYGKVREVLSIRYEKNNHPSDVP